MGHLRRPVLIMIPWQMKLICEFGAQKSGEKPDSSSQLTRGRCGFLQCCFCSWHSSVAGMLSTANPTVNWLGRKVWVLLCCVTEWRQFVGGLGGCNRGEQSCWTGKRRKEKVCRVESGRDAFYGSDKPLAWLSCWCLCAVDQAQFSLPLLY